MIAQTENGRPHSTPGTDPEIPNGPHQAVQFCTIPILIVAHVLLLVTAYVIAFQLRFDLNVPSRYRQVMLYSLPWVLAVKLASFQVFGSFHGWWRHIGFADLAMLLKASAISLAALLAVDSLLSPGTGIPKSVLLIDAGTCILLIGGARSIRRLTREYIRPFFVCDERRRAFMIGALHGGDGLVGPIHDHPQLDYRIVGFLDDEVRYHGTHLRGIHFVGAPDDVAELSRKHNVSDVLVIANSIGGERLRNIMRECRKCNTTLKMLPQLSELLHGNNRLQIRDVDIDDLLRREPIDLNDSAIAEMIEGCVVMITGTRGSIGSEICRQVLRRGPRRLVLVERAENSLFLIQQELGRFSAVCEVVSCIADIGDQMRMETIFTHNRPQLVFHAAAHKHVPLMEQNPGEAITNNVLGTRTLVNLAEQYGVDRFVMVSTDKAVNPTSVMGVSKLIAEHYVHARSETAATRFIVVRFGNVLASAGSVVPTFLDQIRRGGPIKVTQPKMERFFMTIPEASQLVLQAAAQGRGGETFVLDMGKPVRIIDLANDLLHLAGLSTRDIEIVTS